MIHLFISVVVICFAIVFFIATFEFWLKAGCWLFMIAILVVAIILCFAFPALGIGVLLFAAVSGGLVINNYYQDFQQTKERVAKAKWEESKKVQEAAESQEHQREVITEIKKSINAGEWDQIAWKIFDLKDGNLREAFRLVELAINDISPETRMCGVAGMGTHFEDDGINERCISLLAERIYDREEKQSIRAKAVTVLIINYSNYDRVTNIILDMTSDPNSEIRSVTCLELSRFPYIAPPVSEHFFAALVRLLKDPVEAVRVAAVEGLGRNKKPRALRVLQEVEADAKETPKVREAARQGVEGIKAAATI